MDARSFIDPGGDGKRKVVALMAMPDPTVKSPPRARVALRPGDASLASSQVVGVWWPRSRSLTDELPGFFDAWPSGHGRIQRILYSPPDWDDHAHSVAVTGRRVKTGCFPRDDTHQLTVSMADRTDRLITVIDPDTTPDVAMKLMHDVLRADREREDHPEWDNEGGRG